MLRSAIVDTSVLVSAFLFPDSVSGRVVALAERGAYVLHVSPKVKPRLANPRWFRLTLCDKGSPKAG